MPQLSCENIASLLSGFSLVRSCDVLPDGTLRIATLFKYPNGSLIDVFLQATESLPDAKCTLYSGHLLSDCGQTASYLLDMHIKLSATKRRRQIVQDVCESFGVEFRRGELMVNIEHGALESTVADAVVSLAQACVRVADLSFTQRFALPQSFKEEVEEFISDANLQYETGVTLATPFDKAYLIDFRVEGRRKPSLVEAISASNRDSAHVTMNEAFAKWYSLSSYRKTNQLVTVMEDKPEGVYRQDDIKRLRDVCDVVLFYPPEHERLREALAA